MKFIKMVTLVIRLLCLLTVIYDFMHLREYAHPFQVWRCHQKVNRNEWIMPDQIERWNRKRMQEIRILECSQPWLGNIIFLSINLWIYHTRATYCAPMQWYGTWQCTLQCTIRLHPGGRGCSPVKCIPLLGRHSETPTLTGTKFAKPYPYPL